MKRTIIIRMSDEFAALFIVVKPQVEHTTILEDYIMCKVQDYYKIPNMPMKKYIMWIDDDLKANITLLVPTR